MTTKSVDAYAVIAYSAERVDHDTDIIMIFKDEKEAISFAKRYSACEKNEPSWASISPLAIYDQSLDYCALDRDKLLKLTFVTRISVVRTKLAI